MVLAQESNVIRQWPWHGEEKDGIGKYVESTIFGDSLDNGKDGKGKGGAEDDFRKLSEMVEENWCHNGKGSKRIGQ